VWKGDEKKDDSDVNARNGAKLWELR
jgi:hypothetical protein